MQKVFLDFEFRLRLKYHSIWFFCPSKKILNFKCNSTRMGKKSLLNYKCAPVVFLQFIIGISFIDKLIIFTLIFFVFVATCLQTKSLRTIPCDWIDAVDWKIENAENLIVTELISIKIVHHRNGLLLSCTRCSWCSNANHSTSLCDFIERLHFKMNSLFFFSFLRTCVHLFLLCCCYCFKVHAAAYMRQQFP